LLHLERGVGREKSNDRYALMAFIGEEREKGNEPLLILHLLLETVSLSIGTIFLNDIQQRQSLILSISRAHGLVSSWRLGPRLYGRIPITAIMHPTLHDAMLHC
jgi:hypothetical protein